MFRATVSSTKRKDEFDLNAMIDDICEDNGPMYKVKYIIQLNLGTLGFGTSLHNSLTMQSELEEQEIVGSNLGSDSLHSCEKS